MFSYARAEQESGGRTLLLTRRPRPVRRRQRQRRRSSSSRKRGASRPTLGPEQVRERYGIDPSWSPDLIALRGDPSDGLPGAPGIGAKTAAELLRAHGSLEGVLAAAAGGVASSARRPNAAEALRAHADAAARTPSCCATFKQIATLQRHRRLSARRTRRHRLRGAARSPAPRAAGMRSASRERAASSSPRA